jgi:ABC-type dipeptide/oligopeptide/nickel transport system permease component
LAQEALRNKDVAVLSGLCLSFAVIVILLSTTLDTVQRKLDPRARKESEHV